MRSIIGAPLKQFLASVLRTLFPMAASLAILPMIGPRVLAVVATPEDSGRVLMSVRFSNKLVAELFQPFWAALQAGQFLTDAAAVAQTHRHRGLAWLREAGGVRPRRGRDLQGRYLGFGEREEIALGLWLGVSRCGRSRRGWAGVCRRSRERWRGTGTGRAATGPALRTPQHRPWRTSSSQRGSTWPARSPS
jgi:hypothetical protein